MQKIDRFFLFLFQKFSDWTQKWFGLDNFYWARISVVIASVSAFMAIGLDYITADSLFWKTMNLFLLFLVIVATLGCFMAINETENDWLANSEDKYINRKLVEWEEKRMKCIWLIIMSPLIITVGFLRLYTSIDLVDLMHGLANMFYGLLFLSCACFIFFGSCTPKPPQKKKVKKLIEKLKQRFTPQVPDLAS